MRSLAPDYAGIRNSQKTPGNTRLVQCSTLFYSKSSGFAIVTVNLIFPDPAIQTTDTDAFLYSSHPDPDWSDFGSYLNALARWFGEYTDFLPHASHYICIPKTPSAYGHNRFHFPDHRRAALKVPAGTDP
jgi:hypothetical protein